MCGIKCYVKLLAANLKYVTNMDLHGKVGHYNSMSCTRHLWTICSVYISVLLAAVDHLWLVWFL